MRWPGSLSARLGLSLGLVLTVMWLIAAVVTAVIVRHELDEVFDSALRETAERILPLAVTDIINAGTWIVPPGSYKKLEQLNVRS